MNGKGLKEDQEEALADDVYSRIQNVDLVTQESQNPYSYFTDELTKQVMTALQEKLGYTESQASNLLYAGGLSIYTTQDPDLQAIVDEEVNNPDNYDVVYYSVDYRLSIQHEDETVTNYSDETMRHCCRTDLGQTSYDGLFKTKEEADAAIAAYKSAMTKEGDTVLGEVVYYIFSPGFLCPYGPAHRLCKGRQWRARNQGDQSFPEPGHQHPAPAGLHL